LALTNTTPRRDSAGPSRSCWLRPATLLPPWKNTMTGCLEVRSARALQTFSVRQSSLQAIAGSQGTAGCGHDAPKLFATRVPDHLATGRGGRHRSSPIGGAA
jgi:hypothetical protein